jgi:hypothetical protein
MTEGFAFVAYPAEYRSSGVMTFIVNEDGVVYQKDLGKKTDVLAKAMKEYNPNSSWQKAEELSLGGVVAADVHLDRGIGSNSISPCLQANLCPLKPARAWTPMRGSGAAR